MQTMLGCWRTLFCRAGSWAVLAALLNGACTPPAADPTGANIAQNSTESTTHSATELQQLVDQVLDRTLQGRQLNTEDHGAWQIMHGVLAYQRKFPLRIGRQGEFQPALDFALTGGVIRGWTFQPGEILDATTGRRGLRAIVEPGTRTGQGHADQWLAIMAQCKLPVTQTLSIQGASYTLQELIDQIKRDVPYNAQQEWSWTLTALSAYLPQDATWTAADGETWSLERMVRAELEQDIDGSACGGTHRLMGLATAVKRHRQAGLPMTDTWLAAQQTIERNVQRALEYQNGDGSFSASFFRRPSNSADMGDVLHSTGHTLEFLTVAMDDEALRQPQVAMAVRCISHLLGSAEKLPLECGGLYHAVHGLVLYRERIFGPRDYQFDPSRPATSPSETPEQRRETGPAT